MESCVPPGFRFHPTDEELVGYYLKKKVASQKIDLDVIRDIDLYRIEPWDLQERCRIGYEEQNEWYFFSHKDKKYPTGTRTNRATLAGFWKATGRDKAVYDKNKLIGMRKTLVFYKGRAPNGQKSDWIMHEYRLETDENGPPQEEGWVVCRAFKKRTTATVQSNNNINHMPSNEGWDSSASAAYFYEEPTSCSTGVIHPTERDHHRRHQHLHPHSHQYTGTAVAATTLPRQPAAGLLTSFLASGPHTNMTSSSFLSCKQEIHDHLHSNKTTNNSHSNLNILNMHSDDDHPFLQLPQLESPSLPLLKRPVAASSNSISSDHHQSSNNIHNNNTDQLHEYQMISNTEGRVVTDWRALDKFVASQLSHDQAHHDDGANLTNFGSDNYDHQNNHDIIKNGSLDMALLLLQSSTTATAEGEELEEEDDDEDGDRFIDGFLATSSDSDLGICIFDK